MTKFPPQDTRLHCIEPAVVPLDVVEVFAGLAVVAQHPNSSGDPPIVCSTRARFSTRAQVFSRIEAEASRAAHRAGPHPTILLAGKIFSPVSLASVFNHDQVVSFRELQDGIHVRRKAVQVHGDDCRHLAASTLAHHVARRQTDRKSTRLNSSHGYISYAVFCLKKKNKTYSTQSYTHITHV